MDIIASGNSVNLKWYFTDATTGTDFTFDRTDIKVILYSCHYKTELSAVINGNCIEAVIPSNLPAGVYSLECRYWVGLGAKRANVLINQALQVTTNTELVTVGDELTITSVAVPIFTTKIATVEYVTDERYQELKELGALGKRTLYLVEEKNGAFVMFLADKSFQADVPVDEEDLTIAKKEDDASTEENEEGKVIRLKDRDTSKGKGYIILRTEKPLVEQMVQENTIYEVRYDFDLNKETLEIPANCVLDFKGGSIKNGSIVGNETIFTNEKNAVLFTEIMFSGTWRQGQLVDTWFNYSSSSDMFNAFEILATSVHPTNVYINNNHNVTAAFKSGCQYPTTFSIPSNTKIYLNGEIRLDSFDKPWYTIFGVYDKENVFITGNGAIYGDAETHDYSQSDTTHEWGHCIGVYGGVNVTIENIHLTEAIGDGIATDSSENRHSENILYRGIKTDYNRRLGISVESVKKIIIDNVTIDNIGYAPGESSGAFPKVGIDVEPWREGEYAEDVVIKNCHITNCNEFSISVVSRSKNVVIDNIVTDGTFLIAYVPDHDKGVRISNSQFATIVNRGYCWLECTNTNMASVDINPKSKTKLFNCKITTDINSAYKTRYQQSMINLASEATDATYICEISNSDITINDGKLFVLHSYQFSSETDITIKNSNIVSTIYDTFLSNVNMINNRMVSNHITITATKKTNTLYENNIFRFTGNKADVNISIDGLDRDYIFIKNTFIGSLAQIVYIPTTVSHNFYLYYNEFYDDKNKTSMNNYIHNYIKNKVVCVFDLPRPIGVAYNSLPSINTFYVGTMILYQGKPVWWTGSAWVDAVGEIVT